MTELPYRYDVEIVGLLVSARHRYGGRPGDGVPEQAGDRRERIEVRAGHGVVGDRYAGRPAHRDAAVTVLAALAAEPQPVVTPQPTSAATSSGMSGSIFTTDAWWTVMYGENVPSRHIGMTSLPRAWTR